MARHRSRPVVHPRSQSVLAPNVEEPDLCDACIDTDDICQFHRGVLAGTTGALDQAADALKAFSRDPEAMDAALDNDRSKRTAKQQREAQRIVIDEDCPGCCWPERWFDVQRAVFGCRKCRYESEYRDK